MTLIMPISMIQCITILDDHQSQILYMPRKGWKAKSPKHRDRLHHPASYCIISHTAGNFNCNNEDECCSVTAAIQKKNKKSNHKYKHYWAYHITDNELFYVLSRLVLQPF